jgi:hypothetical protein
MKNPRLDQFKANHPGEGRLKEMHESLCLFLGLSLIVSVGERQCKRICLI